MDAAFSAIRFAEPARAETNLALVRDTLPVKLWPSLPNLLAQVPDPDGALNYLERFLRPEAHPSPRVLNYIARNPAALHYVLVIFAYSRFLSETLIQQPELAIWLHRPTTAASARNFKGGIERVKSDEELEDEFARFETTLLPDSPLATDQRHSVALARFKRREYLRIMLRDVLGLATLAETTLELSHLADVLLAGALRAAEQKLQSAYGVPQIFDANGRARPARFTIFALGKLGAEELNYASDIDLMFLYTGEGETSGVAPGGNPSMTTGVVTNTEYFIRLAHAVLKLIADVTPEGAVFRVDLRLRPQGSEGDLAISLPAARDYYRSRAREWELQMLIKARPVAGDLDAGRRLLRELHPLTFRPQFNLAAVEAVLNAREEMTRTLAREGARRGTRRFDARAEKPSDHAATWNVKLSPGGIRDIEFLSQCLQRLYGGGDSWLAAPAAAPTLVALQRLHDKGHLGSHDFHSLAAAYQFLRRVEHRLQLRDGLQRHTLPDPETHGAGAMERLARRCGIEAPAAAAGAEELKRRIAQHFAEVREIYDRVLLPQRKAQEAEPPDEILRAAGPESAPLILRLRRQYPAIADRFAHVVTRADPYARRGLQRFLSAAMLEPELVAQMDAHPEWIERAAAVFAKSDLAVEMLSRHAEEIFAVATSEAPRLRFTPLEVSFNEDEPAETSIANAMARLRIAYRRGVLAALVRSLDGAAAPFASFAALTELADEAVTAAFRVAAMDVARRSPKLRAHAKVEEAPFAVLALGRLGTREMDIGSDADLVFITDEKLSAADREPWRRVAERFVHIVSSHTRDGLLFPVDTRLRPHGGEGEIVQSLAAVRQYLRSEAQGWEAATYLKARHVGGNPQLGAEAVKQIRRVLLERWSDRPARAELARELAVMRTRLEREGTGPKSRTEFKHVRGGFYDIEYITALGFFRAAGGKPPKEAFAPGANTLQQLSGVRDAGAMAAHQVETLARTATLFRSVDHAHRLVTGRAPGRPPEPALAARLIGLLEQWRVPVANHSAAGLAAALAEARTQTRAVYDTVVVHELM